MNEEELQRDILFQIDMQLYDKYNKTIAEMNDHLGDIYTYRDIEEVEKAEREEKIDLLTKAIKELQKEIEELKAITRTYEAYNCREDNKIVIASKEYFINGYFKDFLDDYISKDKIKEKIEELKNRKNRC